jgi:Transposase DDE domain group 1
MGEDLTPVRSRFNGSLRVEARPERLTGEAGAMILREVIERLGMHKWLVERLDDPRNPELITHPLSELLVTTLVLMALGWRDRDDADALRDDPVLRLAVSERRGLSPLETRPRQPGIPLSKNPPVPDALASQPTLSRLVRDLSTPDNREHLHNALVESCARRIKAGRGGHRMRYVTLDVDSLPVEVYGHQAGSAYNGHYHARIYHPLMCSLAETGDILGAKLRPGNVHTAQGGLDFILPLIDKVEASLCQVASVRIDAGFPEDTLLEAMEQRELPYVARIKNNPVLDRLAAPYLVRPAGRPPQEPRTWFHELTYQAQSWCRARRVVLVVQEREGELLLHHFWLLTNWTKEQMPAQDLLDLYRERGTAEGHQGELMSVLEPALSSSARKKSHYRGKAPKKVYPSADAFAHNEVLLLLNLLAYNVLHVARVLLESGTGEGLSLKRLRERVLRLPARLLLHGRRAVLVIGQSAAGLWHRLWKKLMAFDPELAT